jgi:hypothetical protein
VLITLLFSKINPLLFALHVAWAKVMSYLSHFSPSVSNFSLELIFTDVWGPSPFYSNNGHRYYVCFIDDFSKYVWLFPLATKSAVASTFVKFQTHVEKLFNSKIKSIQSDWGGGVHFGPSIPFYPAKAFPIAFLAHIHINSKVPLNANIDTLSKQAYPY